MTTDPHTEDTRILPNQADETAPLPALAADRPGEAAAADPAAQTEALPAEPGEPVLSEHAEAAPGDQTEGATFPLDATAPLASEAGPEALTADQPAAPVAPKVWTAADAPAQGSSGRPTHVRVGQLIWGCIVALLGVFFIALPFISNVDLPALFIGLVGLLGLSLIVAALVVGKDPAPNRGSR
ncbi:hypothetical protein [Schaalia hyovaginalis]|uniref:hypothetical protein n=1 Tax=Schaalia hyovaginalis TaxID=29316 RepID=UPI0023F67AB4|nr:hypothetical protein [Schaalia hyovaginalis]MCI7670882.1 hypothetical protein [Schaalia hyovaginalis]